MKLLKKIIDKLFLVREIKSQQGELHFKRWRILQTPLINIYVHLINKEDQDEHMHSHPWNFISIILKNGYVESSQDEKENTRKRWSLSYKSASVFHKVNKILGPTYTLVITGGRINKKWGYSIPSEGCFSNEDYRIIKKINSVKDKFSFIFYNLFRNSWELIHFVEPDVLRLVDKKTTITISKKEKSFVFFQIWYFDDILIHQLVRNKNFMVIINKSDPNYKRISQIYNLMASTAIENK